MIHPLFSALPYITDGDDPPQDEVSKDVAANAESDQLDSERVDQLTAEGGDSYHRNRQRWRGYEYLRLSFEVRIYLFDASYEAIRRGRRCMLVPHPLSTFTNPRIVGRPAVRSSNESNGEYQYVSGLRLQATHCGYEEI